MKKNCKPRSLFFPVLILVRRFYSLIISDFSELTLETRGGDHFLCSSFTSVLHFGLVSLNDIYLSYNFLHLLENTETTWGGKNKKLGKCISLFIKSSKI